MFDRWKKEPVFQVPDVKRSDERFREPPAIRRHYLMIRDAMIRDDRETVANRQFRLLKSGFEIPITLTQVNTLLEKYPDATKTRK